MLRSVAFCIVIVCAVLVNAKDDDPTYGGVFSTSAPSTYIDPQDYNAPIDKQDSFDWKLSQTVLRSSNEQNVILSPLSVKLLLTILAEAAGQTIASKTRKELEQVLPYNKSLFDAQEHFKKILASIGYQSEEYTVSIATKMFVDKDVSINQRFQAIVQHNYQSDVEALNFNDARKSAQEINKWASDATKGHIKDLVNEGAISNSVILLLNAIYFQGTWRQPFNKTFTGQFNTAPGKRVDKEFIDRTGNYYYFNSKHYDAKILRVPYTGHRYSLFVILPNESNNVDNVIQKLDSTTLKNEVWHMDEVEVHVVLPKFRFDSSIALNDVVKSLGITEIFENSATFPLLARGGNSEGKLKVSNIIQKSGIIVDEKGTTAWAATEIELINKFGGDPKEFVVDRPFLFYIEDDTTGAKLFTGRVSNPQY